MPEPKPYASVLKLLTAVIVCGGLFAGSAAHAQSEKDRIARLEQQIQALQKQLGKIAPGAVAAETSFQDNASDITVRLLALERSVEQLTGQVEEARFNGQRSARQLETLQDDVSLRLARIEQSLGLSGVPGSAPAALPPPQTQGQTLVPAPEAQTASVPPPAATTPAPTTTKSIAASRRLPDEINPDGPLSQPVASQPAARPLTPQAPVASSGAASPEGVDSSGGFVIRTDAQGRPLPPDPNAPQAPAPAAPELPPQQAVPNAAPGPGPVTSGQIALGPAAVVRLPEGTPKVQYEFAFDFLKRQDYPRAESALREFLQKHPKDPLAGNAQYWLGETYYVRGDFQQAAVEFLSGYQKYPRSNKGPDNLLKLGMSMSKLNQTPGACTALGRLAKDYPDADQTVLKSAKAEFARLKCKA